MNGDDYYMMEKTIDRAIAPLLEKISMLEQKVSRLEEEREAHDRQHAQDGYVRQMEGF